MKIESANNVQMPYKSAVENVEKNTKAKVVENQKSAPETKNTVSSFVENKGSYFDTKI